MIIITCTLLSANPVYALRAPMMFVEDSEITAKWDRPGLPKTTLETVKAVLKAQVNLDKAAEALKLGDRRVLDKRLRTILRMAILCGYQDLVGEVRGFLPNGETLYQALPGYTKEIIGVLEESPLGDQTKAAKLLEPEITPQAFSLKVEEIEVTATVIDDYDKLKELSLALLGAEQILKALEETKGDKKKAAEVLDLKIETLKKRVKMIKEEAILEGWKDVFIRAEIALQEYPEKTQEIITALWDKRGNQTLAGQKLGILAPNISRTIERIGVTADIKGDTDKFEELYGVLPGKKSEIDFPYDTEKILQLLENAKGEIEKAAEEYILEKTGESISVSELRHRIITIKLVSLAKKDDDKFFRLQKILSQLPEYTYKTLKALEDAQKQKITPEARFKISSRALAERLRKIQIDAVLSENVTVLRQLQELGVHLRRAAQAL